MESAFTLVGHIQTKQERTMIRDPSRQTLQDSIRTNNVLSPCSSTKWPCFHIVEVSLSLLARASMPLKFWDEAFAAAYLINCTVIKLLDYLFSFEKLSQ
jgi:hypothetical protein